MKYLKCIRTNLIISQQLIKNPPKIYFVDFKKLEELKKVKNIKTKTNASCKVI